MPCEITGYHTGAAVDSSLLARNDVSFWRVASGVSKDRSVFLFRVKLDITSLPRRTDSARNVLFANGSAVSTAFIIPDTGH